MSLDLGLIVTIILGWMIAALIVAWGWARWIRYQQSQDEIDSRENKL